MNKIIMTIIDIIVLLIIGYGFHLLFKQRKNNMNGLTDVQFLITLVVLLIGLILFGIGGIR